MEQVNNAPKTGSKMPKWLWWVIGVVAVVVLAGGGYWLGVRAGKADTSDETATAISSSSTSAATSTMSASSESTGSTNVYSDDYIKFTLNIPDNYGIMREIIQEGAPSVKLYYGEKNQDGAYTMPGGGSNYIQVSNFTSTPPSESSLSKEVESYKKDMADITDERDTTIDGQDAKVFDIGGLCGGIHVISYKQPYRLDAEIYCAREEDSDFLLNMLKTFSWPK